MIIIFCGNHVAEYISQRQPLGGLLLLLPQMFSFANKDDQGSDDRDHGQELMKNAMQEFEQFLIHANIPVSKIDLSCINL